MNYYVYGLIDPMTDLPFYIGKGRGNRASSHLYNYHRCIDGNKHKFNKIQKIRSSSLEPTIRIIRDHLDEATALSIEVDTIRKYGRCADGGILTNITLGGEGHSHGHKPVDQYNLFGEFIRSFPSLLDASQEYKSNCSSSIVSCCKESGSSRSAYGHFWAYSGSELNLEYCFGKKRPVYQWTQTGEFVARFANISLVSDEFQQSKSEISRCRRGKSHTAAGFVWTFGPQPTQDQLNRIPTIKRVKCIQTNRVFRSVNEAGEWAASEKKLSLKSASKTIREVLGGRQSSYAGFNWVWV